LTVGFSPKNLAFARKIMALLESGGAAARMCMSVLEI